VPSIPIRTSTLNPDEAKTFYSFAVDGFDGARINEDLTLVEFYITESLLAPSTQTTIYVNDPVHTNPVKILDQFAGRLLQLKLKRPILEKMGLPSELDVEQLIYRISDRELKNPNLEKYQIHACDLTLIKNAQQRLSKSWKSKTPSQIVSDILQTPIGAPTIDVESSSPVRDYIAENIHPFQIISQQADYALAGGNDPSFLHFMTTSNSGTHHFRSLKDLTNQPSTFTFTYSEKGLNQDYYLPQNIINYSFPCDFDILSNVLNGININGQHSTSVISLNPYNAIRSLLGSQVLRFAGIGGNILNTLLTNKISGPQAGTPETMVEKYAELRQARLSLLDQDKIALRITVPFIPFIHAGSMITCNFLNKPNEGGGVQLNYGSGDFLVSTLTHRILKGGYGFTILDCVSKSVGEGIA
jgi:hypothetical protein